VGSKSGLKQSGWWPYFWILPNRKWKALLDVFFAYIYKFNNPSKSYYPEEKKHSIMPSKSQYINYTYPTGLAQGIYGTPWLSLPEHLAESEGSPKGMPSTESNGEYNFDRPRIV
jgi:hypothetical protein